MTFACVQLQGAGDEREVAEGLRCVAELPPGFRVPFLAEQADFVTQCEQPPEQFGGLCLLAGEVQGVDETERAGEEESFAADEPVAGVSGVVAFEEPVLGESIPPCMAKEPTKIAWLHFWLQ